MHLINWVQVLQNPQQKEVKTYPAVEFATSKIVPTPRLAASRSEPGTNVTSFGPAASNSASVALLAVCGAMPPESDTRTTKRPQTDTARSSLLDDSKKYRTRYQAVALLEIGR
jgi:predicted aconitase